MGGTSDILGHREVIAHLWGRLRDENLHHAYLFEGPEGVGKREVAFRLAQAANCEATSEELPCGACRACRGIAEDTYADVIRLEPEPGRATPIITVDQVREVIRQLSYHRYVGRRRFVIVDPAESMPASAANALLKTLEEPPDGTGFILIAAKAASLLPTILSRCQRIRFSSLPVETVAGWLHDRGEQDPEARARLSMGRPGVAISLSPEALQARRELRDKVFRAAGRADLGEIFGLSKEICQGGRADWSPRVEQVLKIIEDLLRDATVVASGAELPVVDDPRLAERAAQVMWPHGITRMDRSLREARAALALNASGRSVVDAVLVRLSTELGKL